MRGTKRMVTYSAIAAGLVALLAGCGTGSTSAGVVGNTTIKICSELPVSGADTSSGKPTENGVALAIKLANDKKTIPGYTLVHVPYDDVGPSGTHDGPTGATNIRAAIGDALIAACVGPFNSAVAQAEMPLANYAPLALISPSNTNPSLTKPSYGALGTLRPTNKVTYFRVSTTDDKQGPANADYLYKTLNLRNVYIIDDTEVYGKGIADTFQAEWTTLGGKVLGRVGLDKTHTDFKPELTAAAALHPDVIYYGGTDSDGGTLVRQQMGSVSGLENTVYAGGDGLDTDSFAKTTGAAGNGTIATVASVNPSLLPTFTNFKADFTKQYPNASDYGDYSANAYDAANIEIQAIKAALANGAHNAKDANDRAGANVFRQAVIDQIAKTNYQGVTGKTSFDANGDTTNRWISIFKLESGTWNFVTQLQV
ncbi:MAG TPA: branched-chain amino acid ABC transporter substrate-binding protein [Ktedonobacterales bacterium]|nr:branched-chain amino acid ABC transporter substrate-binding protein [Ktedonobacterales bacterium]